MTDKPSWLTMKPAEMDKLILDLAEEGHSAEKIGLILRDKHGVPKSKLVNNKRVSKILKEKNIQIPSLSSRTSVKIQTLEKHISAHKHDYTALRSLQKKQWIVKKA